MESQQQSVLVRQLANRLECSTSTGERIDTLQELQVLAKQHPMEVGKHCMQLLIDLLKEQGTTEEYQEALDLIYRLIKCPKDPAAATANSELILLQKADNIELLLELLEHKDMVVGITTSQILTEVHTSSGPLLEKAIQDCHTGMNKLLQRLPDSAREEIRNQAIVLVQQLTANNEEMKKTVAFNEGFDILFGIIHSEGGAQEAGMVTQDCLLICSNILSDSETCQRLFYEMGSGWFLRLADFFDPSILEAAISSRGLYDTSDPQDDFAPSAWFDQPSRVMCAKYAAQALANSLSKGNKKYQNMIGVSSSNLLSNAAFWIARRGPLELINPVIELLSHAVAKNDMVRLELTQALLKLSPPKRGKNVHALFDCPPSSFLAFGWKPLPREDLRVVSIPSLLAEQVIFQAPLWSSKYEQSIADTEKTSAACLGLLDTIFSVDSSFASLMLQYVLAPPPPSLEDDDISGKGSTGPIETMKPFVTLVLNTLLEAHARLMSNAKSLYLVQDHTLIERSCAILTLLFIHSDSLARELLTAISTGHTSLASTASGAFIPQQMLPYLLAAAGRSVRLAGGYSVLVSVLRLLAVAIADCDRAVRQVLEDPSNLFVLDLATPASDAAGVPLIVQTVACFFIGTCFLTIIDPPSDNVAAGSSLDDKLTQRSFLLMIDSRIGLTRFADILKRPLAPTSVSGGIQSDLFFSVSFKSFYEAKVELIRRSLFDFYASSGQAVDNSLQTPEQQIIDMQKQHIADLEKQLSVFTGPVSEVMVPAQVDVDRIAALEKEVKSYDAKVSALQKFLEEKEVALAEMIQSEAAIFAEAETLRQRADIAEANIVELKQRESAILASASGSVDQPYSAEIARLLQESEQLKKEISQKNIKILNLEENLRSPLGYESSREGRIQELELETKELRAQLLDSEATVSAITLAANSKLNSLDTLTSESGDFFISFAEKWNCIASVASNLADLTSSDAVELASYGLHVEFSTASSHSMKTAHLTEKLNLLDNILQEVVNSVKLLAGSCSDMVEGAGFDPGSFVEPEGTAFRVRECAEMLAGRVHESLEQLEELDRCRSGIDLIEMERAAAQDEIYRLNDTIATLQESSQSVDSSEGTEFLRVQLLEARAACCEKDTELARVSAASELQLQEARAEIDGLKAVISNIEQHDHLRAIAATSMDALSSKLDECKSQLAERDLELNELKIANSRLATESDSAISRLTSDHEHEFNLFKQTLEHKKEQDIATLVDQALKELKRDLDTKDATIKELNGLIEKFFSEKKAFEEQLSTVKSIAAGLEKELDEAKSNMSTTEANFNDKRDLSASFLAMDLETVRAESAELTRLSQELSKAESAVRAKDRELLAALQDAAGSAGQISGLKLAVRDMTEEMETIRRENASLEKRLQSQRGTHDLLKQEADESGETLRKALEESKNKDKMMQALRQELTLVSEELKVNDRVLAEKTRDLFESQNLNSQSVDDIAAFVAWFNDIILSSLIDDINIRNQLSSEFGQQLIFKKVGDANPIPEIIVMAKTKVKESILSLESKIEDSREQLVAKEKELTQVKDKLEKAFLDLKRQMSSTVDESFITSATATPAKVTLGDGSIKNFATTSTPGSGSGSVAQTPSRWKEASEFVSMMTPEAKTVAKMHSDLLKKQRLLDELQEQHTDLLSLLAQQELELGVFRAKMTKLSGHSAVRTAETEAKQAAIDKYGVYTEFRSN